MKKSNPLYILSNGRVAAIDRRNGEFIWQVKLSSYVKSSMIKAIGQLVHEGNQLFVGAGGILLCLSAKDGSLIWKNELKGWGYNFVSIANQASGDIASNQSQANAASTASIVATSAAVS